MAKKFKWNRFNRTVHHWGSILCALPILIVLISGVLLLLKKDVDWIQPPTIRGQSETPALSFPQILAVAKTVRETKINSWENIDRLDIRPTKGVIKLRTNDNWEVQIDQQSAEILQVAYRRSDFIESLHDGTFFHDKAKMWIFLPSALILLILWITGVYLFIILTVAKQKYKKKHPAKVKDKKVLISGLQVKNSGGIVLK